MNWHGHAGILTYPIIVAVKFKIPFVIWENMGGLKSVECTQTTIL